MLHHRKFAAALLLVGGMVSAPGANAATNDVRASAASTVTSGTTSCYGGDAFACAAEAEIVRQVNEKRAQAGLKRLPASQRVAFAAREWSKGQYRDGYCSHDGFPYVRQDVYKNRFGTMDGIWFSGENVAMFGPATTKTAQQVADQLMRQWWDSQGHRENLLRSTHEGIGVGVYRGPNGKVYGTQIFYRN